MNQTQITPVPEDRNAFLKLLNRTYTKNKQKNAFSQFVRMIDFAFDECEQDEVAHLTHTHYSCIADDWLDSFKEDAMLEYDLDKFIADLDFDKNPYENEGSASLLSEMKFRMYNPFCEPDYLSEIWDSILYKGLI